MSSEAGLVVEPMDLVASREGAPLPWDSLVCAGVALFDGLVILMQVLRASP